MSDFRVDVGKTSITPGYGWDISNAYERNTIVSNLGSAYMSVQDVPVNTAISNTDYWMKVLDGGGYVTPEMFGAKGDGIADDSDAIQAALNTAPVVMSDGAIYHITKTIFVNHDLYGNGATITIPKVFTSIKPSAPNNLDYGAIIINKPNITVTGLNIEGSATDINNRYPLNASPQFPLLCVTDGGNNCTISESVITYAEGHAFIVWGHGIRNVVMDNCIAKDSGVGFSLETRNDSTGIQGNPTNISFISCYAECCLGCALSAVNGMHVANCYFGSTNKAASQINIQEVDKDSVIEISGTKFVHDGQNLTTGYSRALSIVGGTNGKAHISFTSCVFEYTETAASGWSGIYIGGHIISCNFIGCQINTPISIPNTSHANVVDFLACDIKMPSTFTAYFCNVLNAQTKLSFRTCIIVATTGIYATSDFSVVDCDCTFTGGRLFALNSTGNSTIKGYCINNTLSMTMDNAYGSLPIGTVIMLNNKNVGSFTGAINGGYLIGAWTNASSFPTGLPYQMAVETSTHKLYVCYGSSWYDAAGNLRQ